MYHVMERGVRRLSIFQDEFDYLMFEEILKKEFDSDLLKDKSVLLFPTTNLHYHCCKNLRWILQLFVYNRSRKQFKNNLKTKE